jgi:hypothetical protein
VICTRPAGSPENSFTQKTFQTRIMASKKTPQNKSAAMYTRLKNVDPSKINNPFSLSAVFLLAVEGLLGYWLSRATDSTERIIAGSLMTLIFLPFLFLIFKLALNKTQSDSPRVLDEKLTPASKEVSVEEIKVITAEKMSGPQSTYTINTPPATWKTRTVSLAGLINENLDIQDPESIKQIFGTLTNNAENILLLKSNRKVEVIPIPGKSIINGVMIPTALITKFSIQLAIIPLERLQPPFYSENSFEHNVYNFVGEIIKVGLLKFQSQQFGKIIDSGREFLQVEMLQELEHIDMNIDEQTIKDCSKVQYHSNVIAIKGDIIDHLLVMQYPTFDNNNSFNFLENDISVLKSLISSFSPLKISDPVKLINEIKEKGKLNYESFLQTSGSQMFMNEFFLVMKKIKELNPKNTVDKKRMIMMLRPFKRFYDLTGLDDEQLNQLWKSVDEAEKGHDQGMLDDIDKLISDLDGELDEKAEPRLEE